MNHLKKKLAQYGAVFMKTGEVMNLPEQIEQKIFLKTTKEYHYFVKNSYLLLDTLNLCQFKDDSDFQGEDVTPRVELVGDNSLTKNTICKTALRSVSQGKTGSVPGLTGINRRSGNCFLQFQ